MVGKTNPTMGVFCTAFQVEYVQKKGKKSKQKEVFSMRGYFSVSGFYGFVDGRYVLFASESDYYEAMESGNEEDAA